MGNVNENIRNFRKFRGMSQKELGQRLNKSTNVVSNWENGLHSPDLETIQEMCKILNVTPNQIFGWEQNPEYVEHAQKMQQLKAELAALEEERERIERQMMDVETAMWQRENPLLDIDCDE